jgi:hypothetical protein
VVRKEKEAKATKAEKTKTKQKTKQETPPPAKAEKTEEIMTLMALLRAGHLTSPEFERALVMLME